MKKFFLFLSAILLFPAFATAEESTAPEKYIEFFSTNGGDAEANFSTITNKGEEFPVFCIQVIVFAVNDETGECKMFGSPCSISEGWTFFSYEGCPDVPIPPPCKDCTPPPEPCPTCSPL